MDSGILEQLTQYLRKMKKKQLKEFLCQLPDKETPSHSTRKSLIKLEKSDIRDVASYLVSQFGEQKALDLALNAWKEMNLSDLRAKAPTEATLNTKEATGLSDLRAEEEEAILPGIQIIHQNQDKGQSLPTQLLKTEGSHRNFTQLQLLHRNHPVRLSYRFLYPEDMEESGHLIEIRHLFDSDPTSQKEPCMVILYGEADMGGSTMMKQVMETWSEGHLFGDCFQYVFYINCREIYEFSSMAIAELITKHSTVPVTDIKKILSQPKQLLFLLDGLNVHWLRSKRLYEFNQHQSPKFKASITLRGLLDKVILPEASLLMTIQNKFVRIDFIFFKEARFVKVLGFSESSRKDYFYNYFTDESQASGALSVVESNSVLWTLCRSPWVSWLVCTCLKQQIEQGQELSLKCQTTTTLCLQFLSQNLPGQPFEAQLRGLCSLAADVTKRRETVFTSSDLERYKLDDTVISILLKMNILQKLPSSLYYKFTHLCLQSFFAVMCCALETSPIFHNFHNITMFLDRDWEYDMFRVPIRQFLFGLLSKHGMGELENIFKCRLSQEKKWELLKWIQKEIWRKESYSLQLFRYLYEIQDEDFLTQAMAHFQGTTMSIRTDMDLLVSTFCITFCQHIKRLQLSNRQSRQVCKLPGVILCDLVPVTDASWKILFSIPGLMGNLKELDLTGNFLSESALQSLCEALKSPHCHLQTLWLEECGLTSTCCQDLASMLSSSPCLTELHLLQNNLGDVGVKLLCEGLRHPSCQLRLLTLDQDQLSEEVMQELRNLQKERPELVILHTWMPCTTHPDEDTGARETSSNTASLEQQRSESDTTFQLVEQMKSISLSSPPHPWDLHMDPEDTYWGPTWSVTTEVVDEERSHYRIHFPMAGYYHWYSTGLHFVLRKPATIEIQFCDWKQLLDQIVPQENWKVAGPLFDIKADPGVVEAVYLPHFVNMDYCIKKPVNISQFHVAHFKQEGVVLEKPTRVEPYYIVLENPSFSPMGVLLRMMHTLSLIPIHSTVLLYHRLYPENVLFHLYLIPNDCTIQKAIDDDEKSYHFVRIRKPPPRRLLYLGSCFTVSGSKEMEIIPQELELCYRSPGEPQFYTQIYADHLDSDIKLQIEEQKGNKLIWKALVKPGELTHPVTLQLAAPTDAQSFQHFLNQYRNELVTRVTSVDAVLDLLYGQVLNEEQYQLVQAEATTQAQMRRLFSFSRSWDKACNDHFYRALKKTHPHLILELWENMGAVET